MTKIGEVIGWKFNHQQGMNTKNGKITKFPGGIPTQVEQDKWIAEYEARIVVPDITLDSLAARLKILEDKQVS